jgi:large subunit ribosomal protein L9
MSGRIALLDDMELLLLEDINGIGKRNDIIVVGDGFALNCLLPQRKALVATPTVRKRYADQIKRRAEEREHERKLQLEAAGMLTGKVVHLNRKVTKTDKLYAAVSAKDISEQLKTEHDIAIAADKIQVAEPIKGIGNFTVQVEIGTQSYLLTIQVSKEESVKKA